MDALEIMFGKRSIADKIKQESGADIRSEYVTAPSNIHEQKITVSTTSVRFDAKVCERLRGRYIAFDTETTGLSSVNDRIIEVGAVLFENGKPVKSYGTLINAGVHVPAAASAVNHITDRMLAGAPDENQVYTDLMEFFGDAVTGDTLICAHNAPFDMKFLTQTLTRLRFEADIRYVDTLTIARRYIKDAPNHKQETLARYFGIEQQDAHRAESDAMVCGELLSRLMDISQM